MAETPEATPGCDNRAPGPADVRFDPRIVDDLVHVVQELSMAKSLARVQEIVRSAARRLVESDGATLVLRDHSLCFYADEDAIEPLWKGKRFPMDICVSGWVMRSREAVVIPDVFADDRVPHDVYRQTFVRSMAMVPIRTIDPIGAIGAYWAKEHEPTPTELHTLQALADSTAVTLDSLRLWEELDARVQARTAQLEETNRRLQAEIADRERAEEQVRLMSITDDLTGLHNRRGFLSLANAVHHSAPRKAAPGCVVFLDLDGLKQVNDSLGHDAGDRMLVAAAEVLRGCFREGDILARMGGDEFAVYVPATTAHGAGIVERVEHLAEQRNHAGGLPAWLRMSIGVAPIHDGEEATLHTLLARADASMYEHKQAKHGPRDPIILSEPAAHAPGDRSRASTR